MRTAKLKLMGECLRIDLRADDHLRCAVIEVEITKIVQGISTMSWPDGCTLGRKRCDAVLSREVAEMLSKRGWQVVIEEGSDTF